MNWFTNLFSSTLGKKLIMSLSGLFLILYLVVHLAGNFQLLLDDRGESFNRYAQFMTSNPVVKVISWVLYATFLIHIIWSIMLTIANRKARGGASYKVVKNSSPWTSRNMGILGTVIFIFLVIHMRDFWYEMHWGGIASTQYNGVGYKDLYLVTLKAFSQGWYVILYTVSMVFLGFHLWHGFASAFQTLGLNHVKYNAVIRFVGRAYAIVIPALFAYIPIYMYLILKP